MANRTLHSNQIAFMDYTDSRTIDVYIANNLPNVQIFNPNENTYSPDWSSTNLILRANVFLNAQDITQNASFTWYTKDSSGVETQISSTSTRVISGNTLTIKSNELSNNITAYVCKATYQSINGRAEVTFVRTQTGLNGNNGNSAPTVIAQYSVNGTSNWTTTLDSANHKFIRLSYDGGNTWTSSIKIAGEDGTSVRINSTAYYSGTLSDSNIGQNITLYSDSALNTVLRTSGLTIGDAYIVQGYLCVFANTTDKFMCTGTIQGPKGDQGTSSYTFIRYATDSIGSNMSTNPSGKTYIGVVITTTNSAPTSASAYTWSKYVGDNAKSIILNADSQVFKVAQNNAIVPSNITITAQALNTTITTWSYSVDGGKTFLSTTPTGVSRSGNVIIVTGSTLASNSVTIKASDGTYSDSLTVYKAFDGTDGSPGTPGAPAPFAFLTNENITFAANTEGKITGTTFTTNVVAYNGTTKVTPVIGTISGLPTGITYNGSVVAGNELILSFIIANNSTLGSASNVNGSFTIPITSPVSTNLKLNWSKVNSGHDGNGISSVTVSYGVSTSASTQPTSWQSTIPAVADGSYLWTRTIIDYTNPNVADTVSYTYAKQGAQGQQGNPGTAITISSIQYQQGDSATAAPTGTWSNNVVSVSDGKYLWTKTTFSDGKIAYGVARQGVNGSSVTVSSTAVTYQTSSSGTTQPTGTWSTTIPAVNNGQYLWTKTVVNYSDGKSTEAYSVAYKGTNGSNGTSVTISSTSVTYQASTSGTTTPTGTWLSTVPDIANGQFLWTRTIVTYSNGTSTTSYSVSYKGINGASYYVHIRYRTDEGETTLTTTPSDYMGVYSGTSSTAPTSVSSYTWYNVKGMSGNPGTDAVTFQIYSSNGYILSKDLQEITLQTFAYKGSKAITSGATYQWASSIGNGWTNISGATNPYLNVAHTDVADNKSYMCTMTFEGLTYTYVVTVEDKSDIKQTFTYKPTSYSAGDIWIVGGDYIPSGVEKGTILKAEQTRSTYLDSDWVPATKYDEKINELYGDVAKYNQYFSFDSTSGIIMSAVDSNGNRSPFSTTLSNNKLAFNQGSQEVAYISNNKLNITEAEVVSPLTVTGRYSGSTMLQAPTINLGKFSLVIESNGSLSIVANT